MTDWRRKLRMQSEPEAKLLRPPVFVVGCMRSGTTFLVDKLTQHPQLLKVGNELRDVWTDIGGAPSNDDGSLMRDATDASPEAAANMSQYFLQFVQSSKSIRRHAMRAKNRILRKQGRIFYDWQHVIPVNKSTQLVNKIGYVHALFPKAPIIFIVREIEAQSASMKAFVEQNYSTDKIVHVFPEHSNDAWTRTSDREKVIGRVFPSDFATIPEMWLRLNAYALSELEKLPSNAYRIVRYEDLVVNQEAILRELLRFLQLEAEHQGDSDRIAVETLSFKNTTTSGDPLTKWKQQLAESDVSTIEDVRNTAKFRDLETKIDALAVKI